MSGDFTRRKAQKSFHHHVKKNRACCGRRAFVGLLCRLGGESPISDAGPNHVFHAHGKRYAAVCNCPFGSAFCRHAATQTGLCRPIARTSTAPNSKMEHRSDRPKIVGRTRSILFRCTQLHLGRTGLVLCPVGRRGMVGQVLGFVGALNTSFMGGRRHNRRPPALTHPNHSNFS